MWQVVALENCRGGVERRTVVHTERLIGPSAAFYGGGGSTGRRHCVLECACKTKTDKTLNKVLRVPDLRRTLRDRRGAHPPLGVAQSGNPEHPRRDCHNGRLYKHVKGCSLPRPGQRPRPVQCQPDSLRRLISPLDRLCALSLLPSPASMSSFTQRISNLAGTSAKAKVLAQSDNDVVIVSAVRSAITKVRLKRG